MDKPVLSPDFIHKKQQRIFCVQARTEEYAAGAACGLRGEQGKRTAPLLDFAGKNRFPV